MPPHDQNKRELPVDGVTRIVVSNPFSNWSSALVFAAVLANIVTGTYLRGQPAFQAASRLDQVLFAVACAVVTALPFAAFYALWILYRRRLLRTVRALGSEVDVHAAAECVFRGLSAGDVSRRCRAFCDWLYARGECDATFVIHWHDEVSEVSPVRTPFEPRLLESPDTLPVEPPVSGSGETATATGTIAVDSSSQPPQAPFAPRPQTRRLIVFIGLIMIAASVFWVVAQVVQAAHHQWISALLFPFTITVLVAIGIWGVRGLVKRDRWFLVPGGVVVGHSRGLGASIAVQMFDRRKSTACILELAESAWLLSLRNDGACFQRIATPDELSHFLRTWLSPVPPPVERLVDFESS